MVRTDYLAAAASATALLREPAVAAAWDGPSALPRLAVSGLAGHLARQVTRVPEILAADTPGTAPLPLLEHYARSQWVDGDLDGADNVRVRRDGDEEAAGGSAALVALAEGALAELATLLPAQPADRVVELPWAAWSLTLDDFLTTRLLEISVHCDDLAVSVGVPTPPLPPGVAAAVLPLLSLLAARRHGDTAVLRALSRAERAPATIAAL